LKQATDQTRRITLQATQPVDQTKRYFEGVDGHKLPFLYLGKIVWIVPGAKTELVWGEVPYESKIHIADALKNKEIEEIFVAKSDQSVKGAK
jgi:hypothetical protein